MAGKIDLLGSTLTRGVFTAKRDRAIRRAIVYAPDPEGNDPNNLHGAIKDAITLAGGGTYPGITNPPLYLKEISATSFGPNKAWASLRYERQQTTPDGGGSITAARYRTAYEQVEWWASSVDANGDPAFDNATGYPNGRFYGIIDPNVQKLPNTNGSQGAMQIPQSQQLSLPVLKINVPFIIVQENNPLAADFYRIGKVNSDTVQGLGFTFSPNTIRYDGGVSDREEAFDSNGNSIMRWVGSYNFTANPKTFLQMGKPTWEPGGGPGGSDWWWASVGDLYPRVNFLASNFGGGVS